MHKIFKRRKKKPIVDAGPDPDFQSIWPPHLFVGVAVVMLQIFMAGILAPVITVAYTSISGLLFAIIGVAFAASTISHLFIIRGKVWFVKIVRGVTCLYAILAVLVLLHGEYPAFGWGALCLSAVHLWLTFTVKYFMYTMYYKIIWERYYERLAKAEALMNQKRQNTGRPIVEAPKP